MYGWIKWHPIQWWHSHLFAPAINPLCWWRSNFTGIPFQWRCKYTHTHSRSSSEQNAKCIANDWTVKCQLLIANRENNVEMCEKPILCSSSKVYILRKFSREFNWIELANDNSSIETEYTLKDLVSIKLAMLMCEIFCVLFFARLFSNASLASEWVSKSVGVCECVFLWYTLCIGFYI